MICASRAAAATLAAATLVAVPSGAQPPLAGAGVEEHVGAQLPADLPLRTPEGQVARLGDLLDGDLPLVLTLAYYRCRMLCGRVLEGEAHALRAAELEPGRDVRLATVSIDPRDDPDGARERRASVLSALGGEPPADTWPFFLADAGVAAQLADRLGFRYRYDPKTDQYAHPAVVFVATPAGRVSSYLYGIAFAPADLRRAVELAASGGAGASTPAILLRCFQYLPSLRRYQGALQTFLHTGAALTLAVFGFGVAGLVRRRRRAGGAR